MNTNTHTLLEWEAASRPDHVRSEKWYVVAGSFCAVMIAYGILSGSWSLSLIFSLLPALYYVLRNQGHKKHTIRLMDTGIEYDGKLTAWSDWKEFWILKGPNYYELHVTPAKRFAAELIIQTGTVDPYVLRDAMAQFVPQIGHQKERMLDAIIRFCKL